MQAPMLKAEHWTTQDQALYDLPAAESSVESIRTTRGSICILGPHFVTGCLSHWTNHIVMKSGCLRNTQSIMLSCTQWMLLKSPWKFIDRNTAQLLMFQQDGTYKQWILITEWFRWFKTYSFTRLLKALCKNHESSFENKYVVQKTHTHIQNPVSKTRNLRI